MEFSEIIKPGMVVETNSSAQYICINDDLFINVNLDGWTSLKSLLGDDDYFQVKAAYKLNSKDKGFMFSDRKYWEQVWPVPEEVTMKQVCEKFGYAVKIVE